MRVGQDQPFDFTAFGYGEGGSCLFSLSSVLELKHESFTIDERRGEKGS